ncbi:Mitochondrial-processing peptidase subunit alpha [Glycine max]|nr:Mitochondrial-processing peptidase subunit alpha [Glycine max]
MQLRFQLQGRSSVTKGKQGRVKETEGVLNGAVYSHCHGFFSPGGDSNDMSAEVVKNSWEKRAKESVVISKGEGSDFVAKVVDLAARELITSASLGQGLTVPRLPAMVVTQVQLDRAKVSTKSAVLMNLESRDIRRELGMEIIEEHTVMEYSKVSKKCEKCGHGEATYYTRQMRSADKGQTTLCTCTGYGHPSQEN